MTHPRLILIAFAIAWLLGGGAYAQPPEILPEPLASLIPYRVTRLLDVTRDTPFGKIENGGDITKALQWACDNAHTQGVQIGIPAGTWRISETIDTPPRSGFTLLGSGWGDPDTNANHSGVFTVLVWIGEEGGTMIRHISRDCTIGNFTLDGNGKAAIGLLFDKEGRGVGTGKTIIEPLYCTRMKHGVQIGANEGTGNADTLHAKWLEGKEVTESVLHMVNKMGMSITVEMLQNISNGRTNQVGVLVDGGGMLWVQSSVTTHRGTLCKVNRNAAVGKNNAFYRFSNTKVDAQADDGFTLVDSASPNQIRVLFVGGVDASEGTKLNLTGSNFVHLQGFSAKFEFKGETHPRWGTPAVLLDACRCWNDPTESANGVNLRMRDCTNWQSKWIEDFPPQSDWTGSMKAMESRLDELESKADKVREALK